MTVSRPIPVRPRWSVGVSADQDNIVRLLEVIAELDREPQEEKRGEKTVVTLKARRGGNRVVIIVWPDGDVMWKLEGAVER